eukprot:g15410.t1
MARRWLFWVFFLLWWDPTAARPSPKYFSSGDKAKYAACAFDVWGAVDSLGLAVQAELGHAFDLFDTDQSGEIDLKELKAAMQSLGYESKNDTIFTMLAELDKELSQTLFLFTLPLSMKLFWSDLDRDRGQHRIQRMTEEIDKIFRLFDTEGKGFIEVKDVQKVCKELGERLTNEEITEIVRRACQDESKGEITQEDREKQQLCKEENAKDMKTWGLPSSFFTLKWGDGDGTILCGSELLRELSNGEREQPLKFTVEPEISVMENFVKALHSDLAAGADAPVDLEERLKVVDAIKDLTYHANYAANEEKIGKLKKAGVWDAWSSKTNLCKDRGSSDATRSTNAEGTQVPATVVTDAGPASKEMEPVLRCLRQTTPNLKTLIYPTDAETHFEELRQVLSPWFDYAAKKFMADMKNPYHCGEGYCGPWIENRWIKRFLGGWENRSSQVRLADIFGPFIPIFMTYVDLWVANVFEYENMIAALRQALRPNVAYITVVQHDTGLVSSREP